MDVFLALCILLMSYKIAQTINAVTDLAKRVSRLESDYVPREGQQ